MKNSDTKIIASAWLWWVEAPYCNYVVDVQKGFAPQRQFLQNTIDLDVRERRDGMPDQGHRLPSLMFWDVATAFPSLSHEWLWIALKSMQIPLGFINLVVRALYKNCSATTRWGSSFSTLEVLSGVLQGCPLSGMLFAIALNP